MDVTGLNTEQGSQEGGHWTTKQQVCREDQAALQTSTGEADAST